MIKFVKAKPIKQISRTRFPSQASSTKNNSKNKKIPLKTIWIIFISVTLMYGGFLLLKGTLFNKQYVITRVQYYVKNIQTYSDPTLYKAISAEIKSENYNVVSFQKNDILAKLQVRYPFIKDMSITFVGTNVVKVYLVFQQPELIIRNQTQKFGVFRGHVFPINSGNLLGQGVRILDLPWYLSGQNAMTGLFFRQSSDSLIQQLSLIAQGFPKLTRIEYLPGGERTAVYLTNQVIYINNLMDVAQQIQNYMLLQKYYPSFAQLKEVDLGSLEKDKIIVRK